MDLNVEKPVKRKSTSTKEIRDNIVSERGQTKDGVGDAKPSQQSSKEEVDSLAMKWRKRLKNNKSYFIQLLLRLIPHLLVVMISILTRKLLNFYSNQYFYLTEADLKSYRFEPLPVGKEESSCKVKSAFSINDILSYYGSVIHLAFALFMWTMNLLMFSKARNPQIDMERILKMDPNYFTPKYLLKSYGNLSSNSLCFLVDCLAPCGVASPTNLLPGAGIARCFYTHKSVWCCSQLDCPHGASKVNYALAHVTSPTGSAAIENAAIRLSSKPHAKPEFPEIFLADILSSMIKVLVDAGSLICEFVLKLVCLKVSSDIVRREKKFLNHVGIISTNIVLALPFLVRFIQCCRLYEHNNKKQLGNAGKYVAAILAIVCSAYKSYKDIKSFKDGSIFYIWIIFSAISSVYSCICDMFIDSELSNLTDIFNFDEPNTCSYLFGRKWVCIWVMVSNALLRFTWIWPLFPKFPKNDVDTASCIATAIDGDENIASVIVIASSIAITFATTVDTNTDAAFSIATTSNRGRDIASVIAIAFATAIGSATHTASSIDTTIDIEDIASAIAIDGASNTATARESNTDLTRSRSRSPGPIDTYWNYDCLCWN
ncbi:hypothetical protein ACOSP7_002622 [Xanthoceras sorbifolium]